MDSCKLERLAFLILLVVNLSLSQTVLSTLKCYQCDSWGDTGCSDSNLEDRHYKDCYIRTALVFSSYSQHQQAPMYCLKEITTFKDLSNTQAKYHQPHVVRRCTSIPSTKVYRSSTFSLQEEYYEDECERQDVIIQSISGTRKVCSCSTDGCNSAISLSTGPFYGKLLFALAMPMFVRSFLISPV